MKDLDTILLEKLYCSILSEMRTTREYNPKTGEYENVPDLRDTDEQKELFNNYRRQKSGVFTRLACPNCCRWAREDGKKIAGWESGISKLDSKEIGAYECTNCGYIEKYTQRKKDTNRQDPTPAQKQSVEKIKNYFENLHNETLEKFELSPDGYGGGFYLKVETTGNIWTKRTAYIHIGNKGKITCNWLGYATDSQDQQEKNSKRLEEYINFR